MGEAPNQRPRVLFVSMGVGAGHNQAAKALLAGLNAADPTIDAEWVDVLPMTGRLFHLYYSEGYAWSVTHAPWAYGLGYWLTDLPRGDKRTISERIRIAHESRAARRFTEWLAAQQPALVVNTHFLPPSVIGKMIADGDGRLRQMVVVTDHDLHRFWCAENVDRYFVSADVAVDRLKAFGVDDDRIEMTGIPVHPKWTAEIDELAVRADWNLPAGPPLVLVSGGVDFTLGSVEKLAVDLCRRIPKARILVLAGSNKRLLGRLAACEQAGGDDPQLRPISFTDRIHELVRLADVVVTKPGGMTTTECLSAGAGMVLLKPVPGQEAANARWLSERGAAVLGGSSVDQVADAVVRLMNTPEDLAGLRAAAARLATPATNTIVTRILETLDAI